MVYVINHAISITWKIYFDIQYENDEDIIIFDNSDIHMRQFLYLNVRLCNDECTFAFK